MLNAPDPSPVPRLAATVMLVRQSTDGMLEIYLTRRHSRSRFMPDAFVFPGGAVDEADRAIAKERLRGRAGTAAPELVVAAVRETFEEAGVLLVVSTEGRASSLTASERIGARKRLLDGGSFEQFLAERDLAIDADRFAYYSNWITPRSEPIRFDAHFFIAHAPADQIAAADAMEVHDGVWLAPREALARGARGEMTIRFPTQKHLERLAACGNVEDAMATARARRVVPVEPEEKSDGVFAFDDDAW